MQEFSKAHGEAAYGLFWLMVVVGTFLLYYVVERPAMRLRERLFMKSPKAVDKGE
jgi:peptidoglycan/LPS O-acetylase OafA/YrhL